MSWAINAAMMPRFRTVPVQVQPARIIVAGYVHPSAQTHELLALEMVAALPVPEAENYVLMALGLGMVCFMARR